MGVAVGVVLEKRTGETRIETMCCVRIAWMGMVSRQCPKKGAGGPDGQRQRQLQSAVPQVSLAVYQDSMLAFPLSVFVQAAWIQGDDWPLPFARLQNALPCVAVIRLNRLGALTRHQ